VLITSILAQNNKSLPLAVAGGVAGLVGEELNGEGGLLRDKGATYAMKGARKLNLYSAPYRSRFCICRRSAGFLIICRVDPAVPLRSIPGLYAVARFAG